MVIILNFTPDDFNGYYSDCETCAITRCFRRNGFKVFDTGNTISLLNHRLGKIKHIGITPKQLTEKVLKAYEDLSLQTFSYELNVPDDIPRI